jgi:hypothetical protein
MKTFDPVIGDDRREERETGTRRPRLLCAPAVTRRSYL